MKINMLTKVLSEKNKYKEISDILMELMYLRNVVQIKSVEENSN